MRCVCLLILLGLALKGWGGETARLVELHTYTGLADASGAVAVSSNLFLVADDEENVLRLYRADRGGPPLQQFDLTSFLAVRGKSLEADLEGAARIGNRAFWIGSHGCSGRGKDRLNRCRFFATDIEVRGEEVKAIPVGKPYTGLLNDLEADPRFARFHFAEAARVPAKEAGAFNIEGLSATPEGHLLIGLRSPIPRGKAMLIPLLNPNEVIQGVHARFGAPIQLDLGGLGIRDIAFYEGTWVIIAGPYGVGGPFRLYQWGGGETEPALIEVSDFKDLQPEAIIIYPDRGLREFQLLSDDGTHMINGVPGKEIHDRSKKAFRSIWVLR